MKFFLLAAVLLASSFGVLASEHGARYTSVTIPLRLKNLPELERLFWAVSDPSTPEFGQFLTTEEIQRLTAPSHQQVQHVFRWLSAVGARHFELGASGDVIFASLPHTVAAALIAASHKSRDHLAHAVHTLTVSFTHTHSHAQHTSSSLSSAEVSQLIDLVVDTEAKGLLAKAHRRRWKKLRSVVKAADVSGDPVTQRKSYGIPADLRGTNPSNKQMVWGTGTFGYQDSDLSAFYAHFNINESVSSLSTLGYQGVPGGDNFGEGTLDTTYISTLGLGVPTIVANTDNSSSSEEGTGFGPALLNFVLNMSQSAQSDLPLVVSMSLGSLSWDSCNILCVQLSQQGQFGFDDCLNYLQNTQRQVCMYPSGEIEDRVNVEFMKLGLRGVTFVAATGDGGSHYSFGPFSSLDPMGPGLNNISCTLNFPTFPAASPYVLAVGGTAWDSDIFKPVAWSASGSGFSWRYPRPDYQKDIVSAYLADVTSRPGFPPAYAFNASNRAYPDVAALSVNIPMIEGGSLFSAGGTSASAPSFAGVISLLNDIRLNAGLAPLGFVNTRLYQLAAAHPNELFYPILSGTSACADDGSCCDTGFLASPTVPWNPLVGLGSPLFPGLVKYLTTA